MRRGEIWLAESGGKRRPVLVLTRPEVIDVRHLVTVAEITTSIRGIHAEVAIAHDEVGLDHASVVNCDGIQTVKQSSLTSSIGTLNSETMQRVCDAIGFALACRSPA